MQSPAVSPGHKIYTDGPRVGINATKLGDIDGAGNKTNNFGSAIEQLADSAALGAMSLRQFGQHDLLWAMLDWDSVDVGEEEWKIVPAPVAWNINLIFAVMGQVVTADNIDGLASLFCDVHRAGRRVVFTLLTLGGGSSRLVGADATPADISAVLELQWDKAHQGQSVSGYLFNTGNAFFDLHALDLRSMYKVTWLFYFGIAIASLLDAAQQLAQQSDRLLTLRSVCRGIEIFNEIDIRNVELDADGRPDYDESAKNWARAYANVLKGLVYQGTGSSWIDLLGVLLPGISSYDVIDPSNKNSWRYKINFFDRFLHYLGVYVGSDLQQYADSVDYHWYHGADPSEPGRVGRLHIAYLVHEVEEIQDVLADHGLLETQVTVYESGASVDNNVPAGVDADEFQAQEVWRRVGGALAAGAQVAGWHSWMSRSGDNAFKGMGLRDDLNHPTAKQATQRIAWFSYQRLAETFDGLVSGRMVLPDTLSRVHLDPLDTSGDLVLFEYQCLRALGRSEWVYLLLIDPSGRTDSDEITAIGPAGADVTLRGTIATLVSVDDIDRGDDDELPYGTGTFAPDQTITLPATLIVQRHKAPLLILSPQRLAWMRLPALERDPGTFTEPSWA